MVIFSKGRRSLTLAAIATLPWPEQLAKLKDPGFRERVIEEANVFPPSDIADFHQAVAGAWHLMFEMDAGFNYEPTAAQSLAARAKVLGVTPAAYAYDLMIQGDGKGFIYFPILNYQDGNLDFLLPLQGSEDCVNSLSDGGAHCGTICDAASPTYMLQHWVRDRAKGRTVDQQRRAHAQPWPVVGMQQQPRNR